MISIGIMFLQLLLLLAPPMPQAPHACSACPGGVAIALAFADTGGRPPAANPRPSATAPAADSAILRGVIRAQGQPLPADMVVYLEPADPTLRLPPVEKRARVSQKAAQFSPAVTVVSVGQVVEFLNDEDRPVEHNVFSNAANARFDLGLYPQGQSRTVAFNTPGAVVLYCSVHKFMDGVVYVCPTPFFSKVDAEGRFQIEGVRAGAYSLKTWQRRRRFPDQSMPVKVEAGQAMDIKLEMHRK
jgi:plastocyanin